MKIALIPPFFFLWTDKYERNNGFSWVWQEAIIAIPGCRNHQRFYKWIARARQLDRWNLHICCNNKLSRQVWIISLFILPPKDFPIPISISSIWIILSKYKKEKKESSINPRIIPRGYNDSPSNRRNFVPAVIREKLLIYSFVRVLSTVYKNALRAIALDRSPRSFDPIHARAHHGRTPVEEGVGAGWCAAITGKPRRRVV